MRQGPPRGLSALVTPSPELAAVIGPEPRPRTRVVSDLWSYIREHGLQDPADRRTIVADDALRPVVGERCGMFELSKKLGEHLRG